jgi:hypothetical protein
MLMTNIKFRRKLINFVYCEIEYNQEKYCKSLNYNYDLNIALQNSGFDSIVITTGNQVIVPCIILNNEDIEKSMIITTMETLIFFNKSFDKNDLGCGYIMVKLNTKLKIR